MKWHHTSSWQLALISNVSKTAVCSADRNNVFKKPHMCICTYFYECVQSICAQIELRDACGIAQFRESQSVKSTLTFTALTSQGHLWAEHLGWSVTFQTERINWVFSGLWRWLFILLLTLIPFDQVHESNGLNSLIGSLFFFFPQSFHRLSAPFVGFILPPSIHITWLQEYSGLDTDRKFIQENNDKTERKKNVCGTRRGILLPSFFKTAPLVISSLCRLKDF